MVTTSIPNGTSEKYRADFYTYDGKVVQGQEAIVPILLVKDDPLDTICLGTGFYVSNTGIFATAAHVIQEVLGSDGSPRDGLVIGHFTPPNSFFLRAVTQVAINKVADVAVGAVTPLFDKATSQRITNKILPVTKRVPILGGQISTWAYPKVESKRAPGQMRMLIAPKLYVGTIKAEYRAGRDSVLLPGPCYETDMPIEGGASGGPVFDDRGFIFAINSSGFEGAPVSFVSHIQSIGGLPLHDCQIEGGAHHDTITIGALINAGHIPIQP